MAGQTELHQEAWEAILIDRIEKRIGEREKTKGQFFTWMAAIIGVLSAGIVTIIVNSAATNAVDSRIGDALKQIEFAKKYTDLVIVAQRLDEESFSQSDKNAAIALLRDLSESKETRSEPSFNSVLESILDNLFKADQIPLVSEICDIYEVECLSDEGIAQTLIITHGRTLLSTVDPLDASVTDVYDRFSKAYSRTDGPARGMANAYKAVWTHKNDVARDNAVSKDFVSALAQMTSEEKAGFRASLRVLSTSDLLQSEPDADSAEIVRSAQAFIRQYGQSLSGANLMPTDAD